MEGIELTKYDMTPHFALPPSMKRTRFLPPRPPLSPTAEHSLIDLLIPKLCVTININSVEEEWGIL